MELSILKELSYKDRFKGRIGKDEGSFKILSNNVAEERMSIKTADGVVKAIDYSEILSLDGILKKGEREPRPQPEPQPKSTPEKKALPAAVPKAPPPLTFNLNPTHTDDYEKELLNLIKAGIKNIWLVGPAGCGKTTITKNVGKILNVGSYVISCGLGTSASEFVGYKYPERESTSFAEFYAMPSIILLDEFTALDPAVAQISNSALANGFIVTTTGKVERHEDCIIIATSNTFGQGASRQYVTNNQLDASTIDRFVGGTMEMDYSPTYEKQFDPNVYAFIKQVRQTIKNNNLRRVASTRMLIEGCKLKANGLDNWPFRLLSNWTKAEFELLKDTSNNNTIKSLNLN